jgi:regulator of sigma E protease
MLSLISVIWDYVIPFLLVLTVLVFVHELGHYWVARRCGVKIEVFSIGFGPEIYGWNDRVGTRWKFSLLPIGGYVKMFGEQMGGVQGTETPVDDQHRAVSFNSKSVGRRAAVVFAGPAANLIFAVVLLAGLFMIVGRPYTPPDIGAVIEGGAGERAGLKAGDVIRKIDAVEIAQFEQIVDIVRKAPGRELRIEVERAGERVVIRVVPDTVQQTTRFDTVETIGRLGVSRAGTVVAEVNPVNAVWLALGATRDIINEIFDTLWQIIKETRTTKELGGPIRIAQVSGDMAQTGIVSLVFFAAMLSVNLGLINLFPIPMLDGGHLIFFAIEAVRGRPLGARALEYSLRIGIAMVLALMVFVTWNDLVHFKVFELLFDLVT